MTPYADAPLETLQEFFIGMAAFRTGQCDLLPEQTQDLLREARRLTTLAQTALRMSPPMKDRFVQAVHTTSDDHYIVTRALCELADQVGASETPLTVDEFVSRVCDVLERPIS